MRKYSFACAVAGLALCAPSFAAVSPSSVKIKVFGVAVSLTDDCASPVSIFSSTTGTEFDFVTGPSLGTGNPADGTYNCVMITMSDTIKTTPAATEGSCTSGVEGTDEVCQASESTDTLTGTTLAATTSCITGEDKVTLYLHTGTTSTNGGNAFLKPTSAADITHGFQLAGAFVVSGATSGTFVSDFTGQMDGSGPACSLQPPLFGFR